jgi:ElaB/YqjD/DUF883 family membrane-anchored ribosome-binding protein
MIRFSKAAAPDTRSVVDDVQNLLHEAGNGSRGTVQDFRRRVVQALDVARDRLDQLDDSVRSGARQAATVTDDYAHAHPWHLLAAGTLAGLALALMFTRR